MNPWYLLLNAGLGVLITAPLWLPEDIKRQLPFWRDVQGMSADDLRVAEPKIGWRKIQLEDQLVELQQRTANLILACDRLLEGDRPEDTIMYKLFEAHGGAEDPILQLSAHDWLHRCQVALERVHLLRRQLQNETLQSKQSLRQQVAGWETLYLTLVGTQARILNLNDEDLHALLDPIEVLVREPEDDTMLAGQLRALHEEIEHRPLKMNLMLINPDTLDQQGILGYLELVETRIATLQAEAEVRHERLTEEQRITLYSGETVEADATQVARDDRRRRLMDHTPDPHSGLPGRQLTLSERLARLREQNESNELS